MSGEPEPEKQAPAQTQQQQTAQQQPRQQIQQLQSGLQNQSEAGASSQDPSPPDAASGVRKVELDLHWEKARPLMMAADRSLGSVLRRMTEEGARWVVVVRSHRGNTYYYAYRPHELDEQAAHLQDRLDWPLEDALDLEALGASTCERNGRLLVDALHLGADGPASARTLRLDATGRIFEIGEPRDGVRGHTEIPWEGNWLHNFDDRNRDISFEHFDLGPMRGGSPSQPATEEPAPSAPPPPAASPAENVAPPDDVAPAASGGLAQNTVVISAETDCEINIGVKRRVDFRIELAEEAMPLASSAEAIVQRDVPIVVMLSVENEALEIIGMSSVTVNPSAAGRPSTGNFIVKGSAFGVTRLAVTFRQGGSDLGVIALATEVVAGARPKKTGDRAQASAPDLADDEKLAILIERIPDGGKVFYRYKLHSEALNLQYEALDSKPLLDKDGEEATSEDKFVERIYARVTRDLKSVDDLTDLQRDAHALGANLSRELFDPAVARRLWPLRDRIKLIQICSWEPRIPWELVRLHNPDTDETDERFLAEYNLVRTLTDREPVRQLPMKDWSYLAADYPMGSFTPVQEEIGYFTGKSTPSLRDHAVTPTPVTATKDEFYDALAGNQFDVLHIACHGEAQHDAIEDSSLIIGDATVPGTTMTRLIQVDSGTVRNEAKLMGRRPIVFLNACETGRAGVVLTTLGGWPNVFLRTGASAFVGTAWSVRSKPAAAFSVAFYEALWKDKTLAEAAGEARQAARAFGDASWLAFKVYGHPRARRASS